MSSNANTTLGRFRRVSESAGAAGTLRIAASVGAMQLAGVPVAGALARRLAARLSPPYYGQYRLARYHRRGFVSPAASLFHPDLQLGANVFIGDRVVIFMDREGGPVELGDRVHLNSDVYVQTGNGGRVLVGRDTHVQIRCYLAAYNADIVLGAGVHVAAGCAFFTYDHSADPASPIATQPLTSKGPITVGDDAWLGYGTIVLSGVRIGRGAVVGAGAVVTRDVPDGAIAVGVPAKVVRMRGE
ncbi:MAG: acyltransferase [Thermoleophilia bacterium]|nr:acyltransferase [Thermoleophilia bacterium]